MTSAAAISGRLRKAGFNPLGGGSSRDREGLRVSGSTTSVRVCADLDSPNAARRMAADAADALRGLGYTVEMTESGEAMHVR